MSCSPFNFNSSSTSQTSCMWCPLNRWEKVPTVEEYPPGRQGLFSPAHGTGTGTKGLCWRAGGRYFSQERSLWGGGGAGCREYLDQRLFYFCAGFLLLSEMMLKILILAKWRQTWKEFLIWKENVLEVLKVWNKCLKLFRVPLYSSHPRVPNIYIMHRQLMGANTWLST